MKVKFKKEDNLVKLEIQITEDTVIQKSLTKEEALHISNDLRVFLANFNNLKG